MRGEELVPDPPMRGEELVPDQPMRGEELVPKPPMRGEELVYLSQSERPLLVIIGGNLLPQYFPIRGE